MYKRGSIVAVPFPFTDLTNVKPRHALVISNSDWIKGTGDIIVVMITSRHHEDGLNIPINQNDLTFTLPKESYVRCHRIATIDQSIVIEKMGEVNESLLGQVENAIASIISDKPPVSSSVFD